MSCTCPETSVLRKHGLPIPRQHDCAYTAWRTGLVPVALAMVKPHGGQIRTPEETQRFLFEVDHLAKNLTFRREHA